MSICECFCCTPPELHADDYDFFLCVYPFLLSLCVSLASLSASISHSHPPPFSYPSLSSQKAMQTYKPISPLSAVSASHDFTYFEDSSRRWRERGREAIHSACSGLVRGRRDGPFEERRRRQRCAVSRSSPCSPHPRFSSSQSEDRAPLFLFLPLRPPLPLRSKVLFINCAESIPDGT